MFILINEACAILSESILQNYMGDFDTVGFFKKIYRSNVKQIQAQVTSLLFSRTIILCCQIAMNFNSSSQHATTVTNTSCDYTECYRPIESQR
jgi:hypothetical protein